MVESTSKSDPLHPEADKSSETQFVDASYLTWRLSLRTPAWRPPTDVYETDNTIVVRVEIPGMQEDDFLIELNGRMLTVRGVRQDTPERRAYHQMEIHFGEISLEIELPYHIETDQVEALYQNGFLRIVLPKARPRQIPIVE